MLVETLQLDGWTGFEIVMEPTAEGDLIDYDYLVLDKTLCYL